MVIKQSPNFVKEFNKLIKKNLQLKDKIESKLELFISDNNHNSLRLHKIKSSETDMWSISIDRKIRVLFVYREYGILLVTIGGHDEVY